MNKAINFLRFVTSGFTVAWVLNVSPANAAMPETLTLEECFRRVLADHPTVLRARWSVDSAGYGVVQSRAQFFPSLEAGLGADLWRRETGRPGLVGLVPGKDFKPTSHVSISWDILNPQKFLRLRQARYWQDQSRGRLKFTERSMEGSVITAYFDLLEAQEVHTLREKLYQLEREDFDLGKKTFERGSSGPQRLISREEAYLRAELAWIQAKYLLESSSAEMSLLMGEKVASGQTLKTMDPPETETASEDMWQEAARAHRGDLASSEAAVNATRKSVSLALWQRLPDLSLNASYFFNPSPFYGSGRIPIFAADLDKAAVWNIGLSLNFPLFSGGALAARHAEAKNSWQRAASQRDLTLRQVDRDIHVAWLGYQAAREEVRIRRRELELRQRNFEIVQKLYETGARYQKVDYHQANVAVLGRRVNLVQAHIRAQEAWLRLLRSAGLPFDSQGPI